MDIFKQVLLKNEKNFIQNNLETSLRLLQIITEIYQDDKLKDKLVLKGGSAVECYLNDIKRLFLDVDMDFKVSNIDNIQEERGNLKDKLFKVMKQLNYQELSTKSRHSYSLDSFKFPYYNAKGNLDYIKFEINYSYGKHLCPIITKDWIDAKMFLNTKVSVLNLEELMGMKLKVLLERGSIKDLFDVYQLINKYSSFNGDSIRKIYLFYFTLASKELELLNLSKIDNISKKDMMIELYPLISKKSGLNLVKMKRDVSDFVSDILHFTKEEIQFLTFFKKGEYHPELLFQEKEILENAKYNPIADFKIKLKKKYTK